MCITLSGGFLLVAGGVNVWAQVAHRAGDQTQNGSSAVKSDTKNKEADASGSHAAPDSDAASSSKKKSTSKKAAAAATKPITTPASSVPANTPASNITTTQQAPPANTAGMVWANTDSGVYHKPGTRWYGKTKQGKYMSAADAQKAGYRPAAKE